ncbi:MAG: hypothetical protein AAF902_22095 [Chloroflexota bacterium]
MESLYVFLLRWDIPIFFIATISLIVGIVRLFQARYVMQRAMFSLEREYARNTRQSGTSLFFVSAVAIAGLWYVNQFVAPTLPPELLMVPTATLDPLETPFASPSPAAPATETIEARRGTPVLVPTATLDPVFLDEPPETPTPDDAPRPPTRAPVQAFIPEGGGCTPGINISNPRPDSVQNGTVNFIGTATHPEFEFYGLELAGPGTGEDWINILGGGVFDPVENDVLGTVNLNALEEGDYRVRLTVFGGGAEEEGRCQIPIVIGIAAEEESENSFPDEIPIQTPAPPTETPLDTEADG